MTYDYSGPASSANNMIDSFGKDFTIRKVTLGAYNPSTNAMVNTNSDTIAKGVEVSYKKDYKTGEVISKEMKNILFKGEVDIEKSDLILLNSDVYSVVEVLPFNPGGTNLYKEVIVEI